MRDYRAEAQPGQGARGPGHHAAGGARWCAWVPPYVTKRPVSDPVHDGHCGVVKSAIQAKMDRQADEGDAALDR
jgi:hypothetical protein